MQANLQSIFNAIVMDEQKLTVTCDDRKAYDSLRVMLVRKFNAYKAQCSSIGMETYDDKYMYTRYVPADKTAIFMLQSTDEHKHKTYTVTSL
jgi:hypothetical protein